MRKIVTSRIEPATGNRVYGRSDLSTVSVKCTENLGERYYKNNYTASSDICDNGRANTAPLRSGRLLMADALIKDNESSADLLLNCFAAGINRKPHEIAHKLGQSTPSTT